MTSLFRIKGFTLLEVMIAVAVIAISLTALLGMHSRSLSMAHEAKFRSTASLLAQSKLAQLELAGFDNLAIDSGDFGEEFPGYRWRVESKSVDFLGIAAVSDHLRLIELSVSWNEKSRYTYRVRYYPFIPEG